MRLHIYLREAIAICRFCRVRDACDTRACADTEASITTSPFRC